MHIRETAKLGIRWMVLPALAIAVLFAAACGGDDDATEPTPTLALTTPTPDGPAPTAEPPEPAVVTVGHTFWHGGWMVTVHEARLQQVEDRAGSPEWVVTMDVTFENLGDRTTRFNSQLTLVSGGNNYTNPGPDHDLPDVPGTLTQNGVFEMIVDEDFDFDDAALIVGRPDNNQARVPLGPQGGDLFSNEPVPVAVSGQITSPAAVITVTEGELRADIPERHSHAAKGQLALFITWSVRGTAEVCRETIRASNLVLTLPDGTSVPAENSTSVNNIITTPNVDFDGTSYFFIKEPHQGEYTLSLQGRYGGMCAASDVELYDMAPFELDVEFPTA